MTRIALCKIAAAILTVGAFTLATPAHADDWTKAVVQLIVKNQTYPRSAELRKEEGTAKVRLTLGADGKINNIEVTQSSGSDILDREAQKMFEKIGALPSPPSGTSSVVVPITWKLS